MTIVTSYDWESDTFINHAAENAARQAWREAVAEIAERAKATLPDCAGRVDRAVQIVLNHDVEVLEDGKAKVASQSNGTVVYHLVNGECTCKDYAKAPSNWCKHRIAAGLYKRATALIQRKLAQQGGARNGQVAAPAAPDPVPAPAEPPAPEPQAEAPVPVPPAAPQDTPHGVPQQHVVLIQGKPFVRFVGLLQMAHERGLVALTANWTFNDAELSLAHAVATFQDGRRFEESGDATPANTNRKVAVHFRRVALTRAKARVLRDALGVDLVAVEELADE
jgi:hypothetical protein